MGDGAFRTAVRVALCAAQVRAPPADPNAALVFSFVVGSMNKTPSRSCGQTHFRAGQVGGFVEDTRVCVQK